MTAPATSTDGWATPFRLRGRHRLLFRRARRLRAPHRSAAIPGQHRLGGQHLRLQGRDLGPRRVARLWRTLRHRSAARHDARPGHSGVRHPRGRLRQLGRHLDDPRNSRIALQDRNAPHHGVLPLVERGRRALGLPCVGPRHCGIGRHGHELRQPRHDGHQLARRLGLVVLHRT